MVGKALAFSMVLAIAAAFSLDCRADRPGSYDTTLAPRPKQPNVQRHRPTHHHYPGSRRWGSFNYFLGVGHHHCPTYGYGYGYGYRYNYYRYYDYIKQTDGDS